MAARVQKTLWSEASQIYLNYQVESSFCRFLSF